MNGFAYHYHKAQEEFAKWFFEYHPNDEMKQLFDIMPEDMYEFDDEFKFAMQSFDECEQVKILFHYDRGEHCLKIKWEHSPWWEKQVIPFYYCVMLPIDDVEFKTPYQLAGGEEE